MVVKQVVQMASNRILVIYDSRDGMTKKVAKMLLLKEPNEFLRLRLK
jgi:hypothetical protein